MISESQAVDIARAVAKQEGWAWVEPAQATLHRDWFGPGGRWEVASNRLGRGAMVRATIDAQTGAVLHKGYIPR